MTQPLKDCRRKRTKKAELDKRFIEKKSLCSAKETNTNERWQVRQSEKNNNTKISVQNVAHFRNYVVVDVIINCWQIYVCNDDDDHNGEGEVLAARIATATATATPAVTIKLFAKQRQFKFIADLR